MAAYCCDAANSYATCSFSWSMKPIRAPLSRSPAKADGAGRRRQRAHGQPGRWFGVVVARRRDVVRRVRVEQRAEVLDMPAPRPELELAAAVHPDAALVAVVVGVAQLLEAAHAGGLDVHHLRRERERLDVGDAVDVRVPRDAVASVAQDGIRLGGQLWVLDP